MTSLKIQTFPSEILNTICEPVARITERERDFFSRMLSVMYEADGIGLAAPQVGVLKRLIAADIGEGHVILANPEIVHRKGTDLLTEGCLSVPGAAVEIVRDCEIIVTGLNRKGKFVEMKVDGLLARVIQHEIDHLNGKLILDYWPFEERVKYDCSVRMAKHADP